MVGLGGASAISRLAGSRTAMGTIAGGAYGAMSDDTSILGGALMGGAGARYLGAGFKRASMVGGGMGFGGHARAYGRAFGRGVVNRARLDYRAGRILANRGLNRVGSSMKGWSGGMSPI
jgi:hypothetical protein